MLIKMVESLMSDHISCSNVLKIVMQCHMEVMCGNFGTKNMQTYPKLIEEYRVPLTFYKMCG